MLKLKSAGLITETLADLPHPDKPGERFKVTVTALPIGQADIDLAINAVKRRMGEAADAAEAMARYGLAGADPELGGDAEGMSLYGVPDSMLAIELGIRHVKAWTGVGTDADPPEPAPADDPGYIAKLFNAWLPRPVLPGEPGSFGRLWLRRMMLHSTLEHAGPKGSAASPGTSTVEAANNAGSAGKPETPAPPEGG